MVSWLNHNGFAGSFDFVYVPHDFKSGSSLCYAFVNFVDAELANDFLEQFDGLADRPALGGKVTQATLATTVQGLAANVERHRNSPAMHDSVPDTFKPALFQNGVRMPFPEPTKTLKTPTSLRTEQ